MDAVNHHKIRHPNGIPLLAICLAASLLAAAARADVTEYAVSRTISTTQDSNAQPTTFEFWHFIALVITDVPNEVVSATVSFDRPPVLSYDLFQAIATAYQYLSPFYTGDPAFLLDYPATTYTLTVDRGAGPETGDVFLPADLFCEAIPFFTGDTYDRLQNYDVTQPMTLTFNGFTLNPSTDVGAIQLSVVQDNTPGAVISVSLDPSETTFEIPADTLVAGAGYSIGLNYYNVVLTPNAGFNGATSGAEFHRSTTAYFTTLDTPKPCCRGDFNNDNQFNALDIQGFVDALLVAETCP